jgi:hypothetical protein
LKDLERPKVVWSFERKNLIVLLTSKPRKHPSLASINWPQSKKKSEKKLKKVLQQRNSNRASTTERKTNIESIGCRTTKHRRTPEAFLKKSWKEGGRETERKEKKGLLLHRRKRSDRDNHLLRLRRQVATEIETEIGTGIGDIVTKDLQAREVLETESETGKLKLPGKTYFSMQK